MRRGSSAVLAVVIAVTAVAGTAVAASGVAQSAAQAASASTASQPATWNATLADVPGAAGLANGGAGVTVAVLDTWVDQTHPEFGGRVLAGADCAGGTCRALSGSSAAADGCAPHGTHVAGILASKDYGIAPAATILPVRVLATSGGQCVASPAAVANGISYAVQAGARVINVSLGGDSGTAAITAEAPIVAAANAAASAGDLVVFAAGNAGNSAGAGSFGSALVVGAVGPAGTLASYSNAGASLLAPGGDTAGTSAADDCNSDPRAGADCIESTWFCAPAQDSCAPHGLAYDEGTSMAAPVVAGVGALLFAQAPNRGLGDVVSTLEGTARPAVGSTYGLVDACRAVLRAAAAGTGCSASGAAGATVAGSSTGGSANVGSTSSKQPAIKKIGCPKSVTVKRGARSVVNCSITPKRAGVSVAVQVPKGRSWVTVSRVRTGKNGSLHAVAPKGVAKLRLDIGTLSTVVAVRTR